MTSADLLLHPVRLRIVKAFLDGRHLTTGEVAAELDDVPAASVYRHVGLLAKAGLLEVVSQRRVRGAMERTYALRMAAARIDPAEVARMTPQEHGQAFMAYVAGMLADADRYLTGDGIDPLRDGADYRAGALWLTDEEFAAFVQDLAAVIQPRMALGPGEGRRRRLLYGVALPDRQRTAAGEPIGDASPAQYAPHKRIVMAQSLEVTAAHIARLAQAERFHEIRERFALRLRPLVTTEMLQAGWRSEITRHGQVTSIGTPVSEPNHARPITVRVPIGCEHGAFTLLVTITDSDQLAGLQIAPSAAAAPIEAWQPPDYADPTAFAEHDVLLGPRELAVEATLSIPTHPASCPAIVLLAGSGPQDRDETLGRNKVFKDLAWGLASRGIAVLRFDKVTLAHPEAVRANPEFTVADEYVPHAIAAVRLLQQQPSIDPERVFVLGHSLGGTIAPHIAQAEPAIAGVILLAGAAEPFHRSLLRQVRYVASLNADTAVASESAIHQLARQIELVDDPELSPSTPASELPFGLAAAYWLSVRNYQPEQIAAELDRPILILQGGRDYQVTIADDLHRWESALVGRPHVTSRVYDDDNHCFFTGTGPSSPAEYEAPQHLDARVITDIANWLVSTRPGAPGNPTSDSTAGATPTITIDHQESAPPAAHGPTD